MHFVQNVRIKTQYRLKIFHQLEIIQSRCCWSVVVHIFEHQTMSFYFLNKIEERFIFTFLQCHSSQIVIVLCFILLDPNLNFHVDMFDEWLNDTAKQNNTKTKHGSCPIKTVRLINKRRRISTKKNTIVFIRFIPIVHTDERLIYYSVNIIRQHLNVCSCICCSHFVSFLTK